MSLILLQIIIYINLVIVLIYYRRGLGLCSMGGPIYAVGGLDDEVFYNTVERYDVNSDIWSVVSCMNTARGGVAVVKLKVRIFYFNFY